MNIQNDCIRQELRESGIIQPFDHWYINTGLDLSNLERFLDGNSARLCGKSEIFTTELLHIQSSPLSEIGRNELIDMSYEADDLGSRLTRGQSWTLWLGQPWLDDDRLYNTYTRWQDGNPTFRHRKKFLWYKEERHDTWEADNFHVEGWATRHTPLSTAAYDGIVDDKAILICYEVSKFFNEVYKHRPTRIPEIREQQPDFIIAPSRWVGNEDVLLNSMRSISRRIQDERLDFMAVRPQGVVSAVINLDDVYVIGPYQTGRVKAAVYARVKYPGYVRLNTEGVDYGAIGQ